MILFGCFSFNKLCCVLCRRALHYGVNQSENIRDFECWKVNYHSALNFCRQNVHFFFRWYQTDESLWLILGLLIYIICKKTWRGSRGLRSLKFCVGQLARAKILFEKKLFFSEALIMGQKSTKNICSQFLELYSTGPPQYSHLLEIATDSLAIFSAAANCFQLHPNIDWELDLKEENLKIFSSEIILNWENGSQGDHFGKSS